MTVWSRRELLGTCTAAGAAFLVGGMVSEAQNLVPAVKAVDHLLLGVADLDRGIEWVEKRTGVRASIGGSHPGVGTRNALLSLGGRQYLEIIAPDPAQTGYNFRTDVRKLAEPRLITWAAVTSDIERLAATVRDSGREVFGPADGSRARPDGSMLRWKTLGIITDLMQDGIDPVPFFIQWSADSVHPSEDSPGGCELQSLVLESPQQGALTDVLKSVGIDASVRQSSTTAVRATIKTSKGVVELG